MTGSLLSASWLAVRRGAMAVPAAAALVLVAATLPVLDDGYTLQVLRGVGVLLACALAATMDDPAGEVLAASPYPRHIRAAARAVAGLAVAVPVWLLAVAAAAVRTPFPVPTLALTLETVALCGVGLAIAAGLRAWRGHLSPSHLAVIGVVAFVFATGALPRTWVLMQGQTWGPPWEAARIRWGAVALLASALLALALRDPLSTPHRASPSGPGNGDGRSLSGSNRQE